jgi:hypothetical protein
MKTQNIFKANSSLILAIALSGCAGTGGTAYTPAAPGTSSALGQAGQALGTANQALQTGQQVVNTAQAMQSVSLTDVLVQQLGVTPTQAQTGAGALFQLAKNRMQAEAFNQLEQTVPGMQSMIQAAQQVQQPSGLGGLTGGMSPVPGLSGGTVGNLLSAASLFQQQGMSANMVQRFIPVMVDYVSTKGGNVLANSLNAALLGQ